MDIENAVMQAVKDAGVNFNPSDVELIGADDGDFLRFNFIERKPPLSIVLREVEKSIGDKFRGLEWKPSENALEVHTTQSEPSDDT